MRIIYVCKKCHEKDAAVTECTVPFANHSARIRSNCDVCGKTELVVQCWAYESLRKWEKLRCMCARVATK